MRRDLESGYIPACTECMHNKGPTSKTGGQLHPLPVPDERCDSISMDFVGPLPEDSGFDCILTITDRLNLDVHIIPTHTTLTAESCAEAAPFSFLKTGWPTPRNHIRPQ
jgi:hypothetical protein